MTHSSRLLILATAAIACLAVSDELRAQQSAPLFGERFASVFDPESRTYYTIQGTEGKQFGGQQPFAGIWATHYTGSIDDSVRLYTGQFLMNYNGITGNPNGSFGVHQRWMTDLPVLDRTILGAGLYFDFTQSRYSNLFQQANINLELLTESSWVARGNLYLPIGQTQQYTGLGTVTGGGPGQIGVVGTTVGIGGINRQLMDVALMGSELELGRKFLNYRMEVYGGYYNWNGPLAGFTNGVKGGVRGYLTNNLAANVNISHDQFFGTNVYSGVTYFFGGSGGSRPMTFQNLMTLPAQRSQQVAIGEFVRDLSTFTPLIPEGDGIQGDPLHLYFVKEGGTGTGTQSDPSNVNTVLADPKFSDGSVMVLLDSGGHITSPIALTHDVQQILGGGSTGTAIADFSAIMGQAPGTYALHLAGLGGRPVLEPAGPGNAVTLTSDNVIQGFTIDGTGGVTNGISGNPGGFSTVINDMVIRNVSGTGVIINPSFNTSITNMTFSNNGTDIQLDALNTTLRNITSTGAVNGSISIGAGGDIRGTTLIQDVTITNAGGFGGILLNNAHSGSTTSLTNVSISGGTGSGVTVTNSNAGSVYNLTNVDTLNTGENGFLLQNNAGTFNVDSTSSITNSGAAGLSISGGTMNVEFNGSITQGNNASAVMISGNHTGTVNFNAGSTINTTLGDGLQFNGADGTYNFLGSITMNGGDAGIDIFSSKGTFVFTDPSITNTAFGMGVKIVGGGADLPITTFNGLNVSTNSNQGFYVSNSGLTTVTGPATVSTQFGTAVEIHGTALDASFTDITSTHSPAAGIVIDNSSGTFGVTGTATVSNAATSGIDLSNSSGLTTTIQNVAITSVGTASTDNGITLSDAGHVSILGGTINGISGDGIHSSDTNLTVTGLNLGGTGTITGDGIEIINNGQPHVVNLSNNTIVADASGISTKDSGNVGELLLTLDNNTLHASNGSNLALSLTGGAKDSTIVQSMSNNTILGGAAGGGVLFHRITFDASGTDLLGTQVNAGDWTIGTVANRVHGDGLRFDAPTGNVQFGNLNIANDAGTGLYIDTKSAIPATTFIIGNTGGVIDTTNGAAMFIDPPPASPALTVNMTYDSVDSIGATGSGISLIGVVGTVTINGGSITGGPPGAAAINVDNSGNASLNSLTLNLNNMSISGPGATPGILLNGQSSSNPILLNLSSTSVTGGNGLADETHGGGGAGIQPTNATISLDPDSTVTGGDGASLSSGGGGGGAGIGGSGQTSFNTINFGSGVLVTNNGIITGGNSEPGAGGGGAGIGGGGGDQFSGGGDGTGASMSGSGTATGGTPGGQSVGNGGP